MDSKENQVFHLLLIELMEYILKKNYKAKNKMKKEHIS